MLDIIICLQIVILGFIIGSFLNVCIYRIPHEQSINYPPSHCQSCDHRLGVWDLIPVFSYLFLRGKCRYCGEKISPQYPCIELLNGLGYLGAFIHFGFSIEAIMACGFISIVIVLTLIDWEHLILPTHVIIVGSIWAILCQGALSILHRDYTIIMRSLLGGLVGYGVVAAVFWISLKLMKKEGMGYGDVRYLGMIGLFTSPSLVLLTTLIGCVVGAVYGIALYYRNKKESCYFAFGPFLSLGALVALFYGDTIISWYIGWCMSQWT